MPSAEVGETQLYYERSGAGGPLLLIQGMSATHLAWGRPFLEQLERSFECIVFDHRGMGRSGRAELPFGLLDALGVEQADVVGISMGGMVAQEMALSRPERLRTLTVGATYCGGPEGALMDPADLQMLSEAMAARDRDGVYRAMWEINLSPAFRGEDEEARYAAFREMAEGLPAPAAVIVEQMRACAAHDTSERLAELRVPTQVIHGTADRLLRVENGKQIARLLAVEPKLLEGVGHMFWWEQPQRSAELIREHALTDSRADPAAR
jgi:pimeloyl-ACP methyl ester carboxylesterase